MICWPGTALHQRHRAHAVTGLAQGNGFGELAQLLLREGFELLDQLEVRWVVRRAGLEVPSGACAARSRPRQRA